MGDHPLSRWLPYLAAAIPASALVSPAICNLLIGFTAALFLVTRSRWRMPPIALPLALFAALTLLSALASPEPLAGWPQIRKFYIFLTLPLLYSAVRTAPALVRLVPFFLGLGALSALWGFVQFALKYQRASDLNQPFYQAYVGDRITGFMSHWMTFGGEMMAVTLMAVAMLLFLPLAKRLRLAVFGCGALAALALALSWTRSAWVGAAAGMIFLIWHWRRRWLLAVPVVAGLAVVASPGEIGRRIVSIYRPDQRLDSNHHRAVLVQIGFRMIARHPLLGVGPEQIPKRFLDYLPEDAPRPWPNHWYSGHLHNIYVQYAAERGLPALAVFLWLVLKVLVDFARGLRSKPPPESRFLLLSAISVMVGILVGGLAEHTLGDSEVLTLFVTSIAIGYVAVDSLGRVKKLTELQGHAQHVA